MFDFSRDHMLDGGGRSRAEGDPPPTLADRLPCQNLEAEAAVLGSVLLDNAAMDEVSPVLEADDFFRDAHQAVYRRVRAFHDAGRPFNPILLAEAMTAAERRDSGGFEFMCELMAGVAHAGNAKYLAEVVRQNAVKRGLAAAHHKGLRDIYSNDYTADQLAEMSERAVMEAGQRAAGESAVWLGEAAVRALVRMDARKTGVRPGILFGFRDLDAAVGGLKPSHYVILAARPSQGKSALALQVAESAAACRSDSVLFVSLEMAEHELTDRYLAFKSRTDAYRIDRPELLSARMRANVEAAASEHAQASSLWIDDCPGLTAAQVCARVRRHKARHGLSAVFVDYLQLMQASDARVNREQQVASMSQAMRNLCRTLKVPLVALCQLSRDIEKRDDKTPRMSDLRESGQIEQDADVILFLNQAETSDVKGVPNVAEIVIAKNRGGAVGSVKLNFMREETRFFDYDAPCPQAVIDSGSNF